MGKLGPSCPSLSCLELRLHGKSDPALTPALVHTITLSLLACLPHLSPLSHFLGVVRALLDDDLERSVSASSSRQGSWWIFRTIHSSTLYEFNNERHLAGFHVGCEAGKSTGKQRRQRLRGQQYADGGRSH